MNWLAIGARIAQAVIFGINNAEVSNTNFKGVDKKAFALQLATDALGMCGAKVEVTPSVQKALDEYVDAYVRLQNAISKTQ